MPEPNPRPAMLPSVPDGVGDVLEVRRAMINWRNVAMKDANFDHAVLLTHVVAWLSWAAEVQGRKAEL